MDCSIGTPCDPPPDAVLAAMASSGTERGYPTSPGSPAYRGAAARWLDRRFGVTVDPEGEVAACVGTKEFVATTAQFLRLRTPDRDTVLYPSVSYPTYAMGATLAGARSVPVPELPGGGLDFDAIDPGDADRALMVWVNSPSNPTGALSDLGRAAAWGRTRGIPVLSDECYAEFTWDGPPRTDPRVGHRRRGGRPLVVEAVQPGRGAGRVLCGGPGPRRRTSSTSAATPD